MFSSPTIQLLVLAGIAVFLILRLRGVLGTRDGFEAPRQPDAPVLERRVEVIEGEAVPGDSDIADHVAVDSPAAAALTAMKQVEPALSVTNFLGGARQAYEMIVMAFERGDLSEVRPFLAPAVAEAMQSAVDARKSRGEVVEAQYIGTRETALEAADFDTATREGALTVRFVGELIASVRDASGAVIDGDPKVARRQKDIWTFARVMGSGDPNWQLVATS